MRMNGSFQVKAAGLLLPYLFEQLPEVKRVKVRQWLKFDGVRVNGRVVSRGDHALLPGDVVLLEPKSKPAPGPRLPSGMKIVHEDEALIVIEKPANLLSIATKAEQEATAYAKLTDYVRQARRGRGARVWIVHGVDDEIIPIEMARELVALAPASVRLSEVAGGGHNDLPSVAPAVLERVFREAGGG